MLHSLIKKQNIITSILLGAFFFIPRTVSAQQERTAGGSNDSIIIIDDNIAIDTAKRVRQHNPRIATLSSAVFPGLGQAYNTKYWKVPIIWGGGLGLYYYFDFTNTRYHRYKLAYEQTQEGLTITDPDLVEFDERTLSLRKDEWRRNRDYAIIFMGLLYVANIVDAMVDAYMLDYDISKNLTLHWEPTVIPPAPNNFSASAVGVNVQLRF